MLLRFLPLILILLLLVYLCGKLARRDPRLRLMLSRLLSILAVWGLRILLFRGALGILGRYLGIALRTLRFFR